MIKFRLQKNIYLKEELPIEKVDQLKLGTTVDNKIELAQFDQSSFFFALLAFDDDPLDDTIDIPSRELE